MGTKDDRKRQIYFKISKRCRFAVKKGDSYHILYSISCLFYNTHKWALLHCYAMVTLLYYFAKKYRNGYILTLTEAIQICQWSLCYSTKDSNGCNDYFCDLYFRAYSEKLDTTKPTTVFHKINHNESIITTIIHLDYP